MNNSKKMNFPSLKGQILKLYKSSPSLNKQLTRLYSPFKVFLIIYFSSHISPILDPIHTSWAMAMGSIFFSSANLLTSQNLNNSLKIKEWDTVVLVAVVITLLPILEWVSASIGLAFCITSLFHFQRNTSIQN
ncbi:hypothetical protein [Prochlorococcus sp. MIT 1300]|uniref:hypothetical protein n=1 Tax=Prochlorococcus sp. MIT 1300 TaxID=3096218 RepID=UPI002A75F47C|nr:hypothetical protein [Prochlorococcus sp. MIT 1300]